MKKINVIGTTGSGKSTFSKQLATTLGYPCFHMDELFWKPNWTESTDDEFFLAVEQAVSGECWVLDGNYSRTNDLKWGQADTVIWLDYSYARTLFQLFTRTIARTITKQELWPGTGNRETLQKAFFSRHSIFIWFFRNYGKNKVRYAALDDLFKDSEIIFVRLRNPKEARAFIEKAGDLANSNVISAHSYFRAT